MPAQGLRDRYMDLMRAMCQANPPIALAFSRENFFSVLSTLGGDASDDNLVLFEAATQLFKVRRLVLNSGERVCVCVVGRRRFV